MNKKNNKDSYTIEEIKEVLNNLSHRTNLNISKYDEYLNNHIENLDLKAEELLNEKISLIDVKEDFITRYFQILEDSSDLKKKFKEI